MNCLIVCKVLIIHSDILTAHAGAVALTLGTNCFGQLGIGDEHNERKKPALVGGDLEGKTVVSVVAGGMHTLVLTSDGEVR